MLDNPGPKLLHTIWNRAAQLGWGVASVQLFILAASVIALGNIAPVDAASPSDVPKPTEFQFSLERSNVYPGDWATGATIKSAKQQDDTPKGSIFEFTFDRSITYPGTSRIVSVYVPAQYRGSAPACVHFSLDGWLMPAAFDELIHSGEMPVTIAIGVTSGIVNSANPPANPRYNRSTEFDSLNGSLAKFLLEEIAPEVERRKTQGGLPLLLSKDPNDRSIGGLSTGGIAAFTAAWEGASAFRRVFTSIGTFVGKRGGDSYPVLIRKTEPKPIRVFMQDGANDQWLGGPEFGDWWMANQTMQRALEFAGYEVNHSWGTGAHDVNESFKAFPEGMRWLWKNWPRPVVAGQSQNTMLRAILEPGENWQRVAGDYKSVQALATNSDGGLIFQDPIANATWTIAVDGSIRREDAIRVSYSAMAYGRDGQLYAVSPDLTRIDSYDAKLRRTTVARNISASSIVPSPNGHLYATSSDGADKGTIWLIARDGGKLLLDSGLHDPAALAVSPDGLWLAVAEKTTHWGYSYRLLADGTVQDKQRFYWFHTSDDAGNSGTTAWTMDRNGTLYAATRIGIQVFDRNGRVRAILPVSSTELTGVVFGGARFDTLFVGTAEGKLYWRKLRATGFAPGSPPVVLPPGHGS